MKKTNFLAAVLILATFGAPGVFAADAPKVEKKEAALPKIAWYSDIHQALAESREKGLPLLLLCELPDQTWSRQLLSNFSDDSIVPLMAQFVPARLNILRETQLLDHLVVRVVPDLRVFDSEGRQTAHNAGLLDVPALKAFLEKAAKAKAEPACPTLASFFPSMDLDALLKLESARKLPEGPLLQRLIEQAGGRTGETRLEALRLLNLWSASLAPQLVEQLSASALKTRLTVYDALTELRAPLEKYDPWASGPDAALLEKLKQWAQQTAAEKIESDKAKKKPAGAAAFPELDARLKPQIDADLNELAGEDKPRAEAAWQRLIAVGRGLVPVLRSRARDLAAQAPAAAGKYDELRFRLLLSGEALRRKPGAAARLASGSPGSRATALKQLLSWGMADLEALALEAACDRDPLVRETAIAALVNVAEDPDPALRDALKDSDANVRVAALTAMAATGNSESAKALAAYIAAEPDGDMIGHALKALAVVKTGASKTAVRSLLNDKRWSVRAAAVEALGAMDDRKSMPEIAALMEGDDGFVAARAVEALSKLGDQSIVPAFGRVVEKHPETTVTVLKALGSSNFRAAKESEKILRDFLKHADPAIRGSALLSLATDTKRPMFEEVAHAIKDPSPVVRAAAVKSLRALISKVEVAKLIEKKQLPDGYIELRPALFQMLKDPDEELRLQIPLTLCYFGDWRLCELELARLFAHDREQARIEAVETLSMLPAQTALEMVKARVALPQEVKARECSSLVYALTGAQKATAQEWAENDPLAEAMFLLLPRVPRDGMYSWWRCVHDMAQGRNRSQLSAADQAKNRKALAAFAGKHLKTAAAGQTREVLQLLWMRNAELSAEQREALAKDPSFEVRRMAIVQQIRAVEKGPANIVVSLVTDPNPELRRLAVAAAIPSPWRRSIEDPIDSDLVAGEKVALYSMRYEYGDRKPKVVELPIETLEALLKDDDEEVRVITAFLMALEGGDHGIAVLVKKWKSSSNSYRASEALLKAITMAWDDSLTKHLQAMYESYSQNDREWEIRNIYQQTNGLKGVQLKKLRARIKEAYPNL